jgi:hypothetical protein
MDLDKITTDELMGFISGETDKWEFKGAELLDPKNKHDLKVKIGEQVSGFANSGGGFIVLGIDRDKNWQECPPTVGRQTMKDYLAQLVEQSVDYPIRSFRVHQVPFTNEPGKHAYVIAVEDSPAAPHQTKDDKRAYYWRIDGHTKPAPHFHLELLRNRFTKAVLQIENIESAPLTLNVQRGLITVRMKMTIRNISRQATHHWGMYAKCEERMDWRVTQGRFIHGVWFPSVGSPVILPGEPREYVFEMMGDCGSARMHNVYPFVQQWQYVNISFWAVSDNHPGIEYKFGDWPKEHWFSYQHQFERELEQLWQQQQITR